MADAFPLDEAQLVALFMESIFYGLYLVSFAACIRALFSGAGIKSATNKAMLVVTLLLGIIGTLDLAFGLRHALEAFIWYRGPGGAIAEFEDISNWVDVMKQVTYVIQTLIADLVLIYRCFMVYNKSWLVISVPLLMWAATLVCGSAVIFISSRLRISTNVDDTHLVPFITSTLVLTLVQNLATTSLLAYRILTLDRRIAQSKTRAHPNNLRPWLRPIVESGAIYTLSVFIFLVTYLCSNNAQYPVSDAGVQIIGIVFNLIIIRMHEGRTAEQEFTRLQTLGSVANGQPQNGSGTAGNYPLEPVKSHATQDGDEESAME